jgi:hypothetical protein
MLTLLNAEPVDAEPDAALADDAGDLVPVCPYGGPACLPTAPQ